MDKQGLPSYAQPNWQGDALALTKDRMKMEDLIDYQL